MYQKYLIRPFQMLGTPICLLMSIYAAFVYGESKLGNPLTGLADEVQEFYTLISRAS
jgi:hypothetical protein